MAAEIKPAVRDTNLWVVIDARGMPKITELRMAEIIHEKMEAELSTGVQPEDILGVQSLPPKQAWLVYMANVTAKVNLVSQGSVDIAGRQYVVREFKQQGLSNTQTRVSIHGIPLHVSNDEVQQWLDASECFERCTPVTAHVVTKGAEHSKFKNLLSGNRVCFAKQVIKPIPRYATFTMQDPMELDDSHPSLIEMDVVVYHEGQLVLNCSICKDDDHVSADCPTRRTRKSVRRAEKTCFRCGEPGHLARECGADAESEDGEQSITYSREGSITEEVKEAEELGNEEAEAGAAGGNVKTAGGDELLQQDLEVEKHRDALISESGIVAGLKCIADQDEPITVALSRAESAGKSDDPAKAHPVKLKNKAKDKAMWTKDKVKDKASQGKSETPNQGMGRETPQGTSGKRPRNFTPPSTEKAEKKVVSWRK